jgi:hypothetical protein
MVGDGSCCWVSFVDLKNIFFICRVLILVWFALLFIATFVHWWANIERLPPLVFDLILALSLQRNANDSMRTKRDEAPNFHAAQGIQVIFLFLLASGYIFFLMMPYLGKYLMIISSSNFYQLRIFNSSFSENPMFAYEFSDQFLYQPLMNFSFYVDGLLVLGALRLALKPSDKFATFFELLKQLFRRFSR